MHTQVGVADHGVSGSLPCGLVVGSQRLSDSRVPLADSAELGLRRRERAKWQAPAGARH
jgi:hypothetical protein